MPDGSMPLADLPGAGPLPCETLLSLVDVPFSLPKGDDFVGGTGDPEHAYVDGALDGWENHPEWMDYLDPTSPCHGLKLIERDLYLHHWAHWLSADRVLDLGCGIGRMTHAFLDRGAAVHGVDADLQSLQRCAWYAAGRSGALDLHWQGVHTLPDETFDLIVSAEVLCYVPEAENALRNAVSRLRSGGTVLLSLEARWGWAVSEDAPEGALNEAVEGTGIIDLPGERWVRTYDRDDVAALFEACGLQTEAIVATHYILDGPLEGTQPGVLTLRHMLQTEEKCRNHPVWAPLNRIWTAVATKP